MSHGALRLPDFLIVGAMKGGTTAMARYLGAHPDIYMARGEPKYFSRDANWSCGAEYYATFFQRHGGAARVGEKTPDYCWRQKLIPPIPQRIVQLLPDARLIWCLRSPVHRAYSHYWHNVTRGEESRSFEAALRNEEARLAGTRIRSYRDRGVYVTQILRFLECFPRERMWFVLSERLLSDPRGTLTGTYQFLGVDPERAGTQKATRFNVARMQVGPLWAQRIIAPLLRHLPPAHWKAIERALGSARPPLAEETRLALDEFYRPHNVALASLTGLDLSVWETPPTKATQAAGGSRGVQEDLPK